MEFFVVLIVLIIILIAIRTYIRYHLHGSYIEIFQMPSRVYMLPEELRKSLEEKRIRYRTVRKGGLNMPFAPLVGPQYLGLEVHVEDLERGRRALSEIQNKQTRSRSQN